MKPVVILLLIFCSFVAGQKNAPDEWQKISTYEVCFEAAHNRYGFLHYNGKVPRLVAGLKLVHKKGVVRCVTDTDYDSKWGCYRYDTFKSYRLNVVVTDSNNNVIFPKPEYIKHAAGLWYWLPGIDERHSDELVFTDFAHPFYVTTNTELRLWYGEDLMNWSDTDNQGRVCVEVYARFI